MTEQDVIEILNRDAARLQELISSAAQSGDIATVDSLENNASETRRTLKKFQAIVS